LHRLISEASDYHNSSNQLLFVWTTGNKWLNIMSEWAALLLEIYQTSPESWQPQQVCLIPSSQMLQLFLKLDHNHFLPHFLTLCHSYLKTYCMGRKTVFFSTGI
jgi:hypothetical protein